MTTRKTLVGVLSLALTVLALAAPVRAAEAELAEKTGGYGGGFEQATMYRWPDRFHLRTCFGISDPAAAQDLTLALAYLLLCGVGLRANDRFGPSAWCSSNDRLACSVFFIGRVMFTRMELTPAEAVEAVRKAMLAATPMRG